MKIRRLVWPHDRIEHIARHGITPHEFEEACFGKSFVRRAKARGRSPKYYDMGESGDGRNLFRVVIRFPDGNGFPVTARDMTRREKGRYRAWKRR